MLNSDAIRAKKLEVVSRLKARPEWKGEKEKLLIGLLEQVWQVAPNEEVSDILARAEKLDVSYFQQKMSEDAKMTRYGAGGNFTIEEQFDSSERKLLRTLTQWQENPELSEQWILWVSTPELKEEIGKILEK